MNKISIFFLSNQLRAKEVKLYLRLFFLFFFMLLASTSKAQKTSFGFQENYVLKKGGSVIEPNPKLIKLHNQSIAFLNTQILVNRIVKNDSLYHFFSIVYKSTIKETIWKSRKSKKITGFKIIDKNNRLFKILKTENNQILVFYKEPSFKTKICINTIAKSRQVANSFYENIKKWLTRLSKQ